MIDSIYVYDDIISKDKQNLLETYFSADNLNWQVGNNLPYLNTFAPQSAISSKNISNTDISKLILEIETKVGSKLNANILTNYRYKVNLLKVSDYSDTRNELESIHIDRNDPHISMVYYINDTDGDTKFYDLVNGDISNWKVYLQKEEYHRFKEFKSVSPKKGRIVIFDGLIFHRSTYPKLNNRLVLNFNTVIKLESKSLI